MRDRAAAAGALAALAGAALASLPLIAGRAGSAAAHEPELSRYTYWRDVRPLLVRRCASCHSGAGPAPVNLMGYADALPWANSIARQVLERRMPPWLPDDGTGDFAHSRTLDDRETDLLVDWAIGLAPEGAPPAAGVPPPAPKVEAAFPAPRLTLTEPVRIGAMESEAVVCAPLRRSADTPPAAVGFALIPGEAVSILRRAALFIGGDCGTGTPVFTWVVGQGPRRRPPGVFDPLPPGADLFLELAYRKGFDTEGLAFEDAPEVAVFPADAAPGAAVEGIAVESGSTRLGAGALLAILPPSGFAPGSGAFAVELVSRGGAVTPLLRIRRPDPDWIEKFAFRAPVPITEGAAIRVSHPGAILDLVRPQATGPAESR